MIKSAPARWSIIMIMGGITCTTLAHYADYWMSAYAVSLIFGAIGCLILTDEVENEH